MKLSELHDLLIVRNIDDNKVLTFGISNSFSWRGSYDCVAFSVARDITVAEHNQNIQNAFGEHTGYKGGDYFYDEDTEVFFTGCPSSTSKAMIEDMSDQMLYYVDEKVDEFNEMMENEDLSTAFTWLLSQAILEDIKKM